MVLVLIAVCIAALAASGGVAYAGFFAAQNVAKLFIEKQDYHDEKITVDKLKAGDHIYVPGAASESVAATTGINVYYHHGVYLGNNVVTDFGNGQARPEKRHINEFLGKRGASNLYRRNYGSSAFTVEKTLSYADKACEIQNWPTYNLLSNNCEHYATLLKLGERWSEQAKLAPQEPVYREFFRKYENASNLTRG